MTITLIVTNLFTWCTIEWQIFINNWLPEARFTLANPDTTRKGLLKIFLYANPRNRWPKQFLSSHINLQGPAYKRSQLKKRFFLEQMNGEMFKSNPNWRIWWFRSRVEVRHPFDDFHSVILEFPGAMHAASLIILWGRKPNYYILWIQQSNVKVSFEANSSKALFNELYIGPILHKLADQRQLERGGQGIYFINWLNRAK